MKIFVSTSNNYHHALPAFTHLFNRYWGEDTQVTILCYKIPNFNPPSNFKYEQLNGGDQETVQDYTRHLRTFFETVKDDYFIYLMEDTFIKSPINFEILDVFKSLCVPEHNIGRIDLTEGVANKPTSLYYKKGEIEVLEAPVDGEWKVTCQASIWNKQYFIDYAEDGLDPWQFEKQQSQKAKKDNRRVLGTCKHKGLVMYKNEGIRKNSVNTLDLNGVDPVELEIIKKLYNEKN